MPSELETKQQILKEPVTQRRNAERNRKPCALHENENTDDQNTEDGIKAPCREICGTKHCTPEAPRHRPRLPLRT